MEKKAIHIEGSEGRTVSYSPAILATGQKWLFISGQVARDEKGNVVGKGDLVAQAKYIYGRIHKILNAAGGDFNNIVAMNYYVTDFSLYPKVAELRFKYFTKDFPASTAVEVKALVDKDMLLEVQAIAVL